MLVPFRDVTIDAQRHALAAHISTDRDRANTSGGSIENIRDALHSAFAEHQVSTIYRA